MDETETKTIKKWSEELKRERKETTLTPVIIATTKNSIYETCDELRDENSNSPTNIGKIMTKAYDNAISNIMKE
jgi:hypothetical protein